MDLKLKMLYLWDEVICIVEVLIEQGLSRRVAGRDVYIDDIITEGWCLVPCCCASTVVCSEQQTR